MSAVGTAVINVMADTDAFERKITGGLGGAFKKLAGIASAAFAGVQVGQFLKGAIGEAEEARDVMKQTAARIKDTGGAAKVSAKDIDVLAGRLSNLTGVDDEAIASSSNLLLTFTKIRNETGKGNDIFDQATKTVLNMSKAFGQDTSASAIQLGKALQDPITGITALTRVGAVNKDEAAKLQAKWKEGTPILQQQKDVLALLASQTGSAAEAGATASMKLGVAWGNFKETIGTALLPTIDMLAKSIGENLPAFADKAGKKLNEILPKIAMTIRAFFAAASGEGVTSDGFVGEAEKMGVAARELFFKLRDDVLPKLKELGKVLVDVLVPAVMLAAKNIDIIVAGMVAWKAAMITKTVIAGVTAAVNLFSLAVGTAGATSAAAAPGIAAATGSITLLGAALPVAAAAIVGAGIGTLISREFIQPVNKAITDATLNTSNQVDSMVSKVITAVGKAGASGSQMAPLSRAINDLRAEGNLTAESMSNVFAQAKLIGEAAAAGIKTANAVKEIAKGGDSARVAVKKLQDQLDKLKSKQIVIDIITSGRGVAGEPGAAMHGGQIVKGFATGGTFPTGRPILVGEVGPELIIPSQAGRIVSNRDLLRALSEILQGKQSTASMPGITNITVNEVANDPQATARAVAARLGAAAVRA